MLLNVFHETRYAFDAPAAYWVQRLMLTPLSFEGHSVKRWEISAPGIGEALAYADGFGNTVHLVTGSARRDSITISARGQVATENRDGIAAGLPQTLPDAVFLRQTQMTKPDEALRALAAEADRAGASALARMHALLGLVQARIAYETDATDAHTTAAEALARGKGVCQDHAHAFLGAARHLGIPGRFITGYIVTGTGKSSTAGHAWAEALVPDLGWCGFDASNGKCPDEHYVRLASGLDARGAAPVSGSRRGGGSERMSVEVFVEAAEQ